MKTEQEIKDKIKEIKKERKMIKLEMKSVELNKLDDMVYWSALNSMNATIKHLKWVLNNKNK